MVDTTGIQEPLLSVIEDAVHSINESVDEQSSVSQSEEVGQLGKVLQAHGIYGSAVEVFTHAYELDERLEWLYFRAISLNELGLIREALADYALILESASEDPLMWFRYGEALHLNGQVSSARIAFEKVLELEADHAAAKVRLADTFLAESELDKALKLLLEAWELDSTAGQVAFRISRIYKQLGKSEQATVWLERRNERAPLIDDRFLQEVAQYSLNPAFFRSIGQKAWERGEHQDAIGAYRLAIDMGARDETTILDFANMLLFSGATEDLQSILETAVQEFPESPRGWFIFAQAIADSDPTLGLTYSQKSLDLEYQSQVHIWQANLLMKSRRFEQAAEEFLKLRASMSENPYLAYWAALAQVRKGDCEAGLVVLKDALELAPQWGQAHIVNTRLEALCGNAEFSLNMARQLLEINESSEVRLTLMLAELVNGNWNTANLKREDRSDQDFLMFQSANRKKQLPELPFHEESDWWTPP